ncbi:MAG: Hsp20/alpha crystallin family protein [Candidatus Thorarchaeota archaeon]
MTEIKKKKDIETKSGESIESNESIKETPEKQKQKNAIQLRKYRPLSLFSNFDQFFDEMDRYFNKFWSPTRLWDVEPFSLKIFDEDEFFRSPLTNITDEGDKYSITAELPGLEKGDIEITVHDGILDIKGEQKNEHEEKKDGFIRKEYHSSSYHRSFTIPENIDEENIDAKLDKGILTLKLPKKEIKQKEKKKIEVQ